MSLKPPSETDRVSKVTFSAINSEALVVSIRSVMPKPEELTKMNTPKQGGLHDSKKKSRSKSCSEKSSNKSTMTDYKKEVSCASQTSVEEMKSPVSRASPNIAQQTPCLKHASENISLKASEMPSEKVSLCNNCSKSMLSYIFVVQDFLDSLAKEICVGEGSKDCLQCMREKVRQQMISKSEENLKSSSRHKTRDSNTPEKTSSKSRRDTKITGGASDMSSHRSHETKSHKSFPLNDGHSSNVPSGHSSNIPSGHSNNQSPNHSPSQGPEGSGNVRRDHSSNFVPPGGNHGAQNTPQPGQYQSENKDKHHNVNVQSDASHQQFKPLPSKIQFVPSSNQPYDNNQNIVPSSANQNIVSSSENQNIVSSAQGHQVSTNEQNKVTRPEEMFGKLMGRQQPTLQLDQGDSNNNFPPSDIVTSPFGEQTDRIISGLSNVEREVYDSARNNAGWENLAEAQERLVGPDGRILSEAYVTMCRNNAEAIGALVLGTSLLLTQTSRTLCVVVSDGVSMAFRGPLSSVFHIVQTVRSMDSLGTTKLALLEQPELGISFDKLNVWRLKQFRKCVYLNPDTLVIKNCDELFNREELSAVADIGWPDCFNSGVFVFAPRDKTFWELLEFSDKQGSFDGGDQGLLNTYFKTWNSDINKKLSFIYNLMANVSYTYTPAFKQFGKDVKIVQFHGSFKPWHVKFFNVTGLISPTSNVHPNYVEFVNRWIKIFKGNALRQLSQEIQSYAASQELICAVELLRFFPLPTESETEFFLTPPSVRVRLNEMKLRRPQKSDDERLRRKSAEFSHKTIEEIEKEDSPTPDKSQSTPSVDAQDIKSSAGASEAVAAESAEASTAEATKEDSAAGVTDEGEKLPGAEVGNYMGMKKWEQGKMDYQGEDSSDSIIKRLEFLMYQSK